MTAPSRLPALHGAATALLAAVLFGASTPLVQRFGAGLGPFTTAALLYAGAAAIGLLLRRPVEREAKVARAEVPRLIAVAACGAVVGPVALAWGLQRTSATSASLLLTLEVVFTAAFAWLVHRDAVDRRVAVAMALLVVGAALLVADPSRAAGAHLAGLAAVALATAAWAVDNVLSRPLADRDPGQVVMLKAALGAVAAAAIGTALGEPFPHAAAALGLLAVGATGYGLSLRFYLLAQRAFGATRTSSVFAFAPFIGAAVAIALGERAADAYMLAGGAAMLAGVVLHLSESHGHDHLHESLEHEHAHRHDDDHHDRFHGHAHDAVPVGTHSHRHRHLPAHHSHAHVPDAHHAHEH